MGSIIKSLEDRFLPEFRVLAEKLGTEVSNIRMSVYSHSVGASTEYQGHSIGVECLFLDAPIDSTDNVALGIDLAYLTTTPRISADVCWGHPSGKYEAFFGKGDSSTEWDEVSETILAELDLAMPKMINAFIKAVKRREPSDV